MKKIAVLMHIYYQDTWKEIKEFVLHLNSSQTTFYFNICVDQIYTQHIIQEIKKDLKNAFVIKTPNIGKDIGGKLALINLLQLLGDESEYLLLLHDKKSPHISTGTEWRNELLSIAGQPKKQSVFDVFDGNKKVGIIATTNFIVSEYDEKTRNFSCTSNELLKKLKQDFELKNETFEFVAGTMFWIRGEIYRRFFRKFGPLSIRSTLEQGNVLDHESGSFTHAWERMLSWIALSEGYKIRGL